MIFFFFGKIRYLIYLGVSIRGIKKNSYVKENPWGFYDTTCQHALSGVVFFSRLFLLFFFLFSLLIMYMFTHFSRSSFSS